MLNFDKEVGAYAAIQKMPVSILEGGGFCRFTTCVEARPGELHVGFCFAVGYRSISNIPRPVAPQVTVDMWPGRPTL